MTNDNSLEGRLIKLKITEIENELKLLTNTVQDLDDDLTDFARTLEDLEVKLLQLGIE